MKKASLFLIICSAALLPLVCLALEYPFSGMTNTASPGQYILTLFKWGLGIVGALVVASIAYGGFTYMIGSVEKGKDIITSALIGLLLLFGAWLILYTINPNLAKFQEPTLEALGTSPGPTPSTDIGTDSTENIGATITGKETSTSCSINSCGSTQIQGNTMSTAAAQKYSALESEIKAACQSQGYTCDTKISNNGTVSGTHSSSCHTASTAKGGTCADFTITGCTTQTCINIAANAMQNSQNVVSCLNEYQVSTTYSTGGHFHCNF